MRFEPERVLAQATKLPWPSLAPSDGDRSASEQIALGFESSGLVVERNDLPAARKAPIVLILEIIAFLCILPSIALVSTSLGIPLGLMAAILIGLSITQIWSDRHARALSTISPPCLMIGKLPNPQRPPLRMVVLTESGPTDSRGFDRWATIECATFAIFMGIIAVHGLEVVTRADRWIWHAMVLGEWVAIIAMLLTMGHELGSYGREDDRINLATLVELARTWPKGLRDRIDAWFVVTPDSKTLDRFLRLQEGDVSAWLVVSIVSQTNVTGLMLQGHGPAFQMAQEAAKALWIPYRTSWNFRDWIRDRFHPGTNTSRLLLVYGRKGRRGLDPDSGLLSATAQLVTEVAFRWARQNANIDDQGESLARSSQKRG